MILSHLRLVLPRRTFCSSAVRFSGHNKWSKIKEKKGANDLKKSAVYSKISRTDLVIGGGSTDPEKNASLAAVLKAAKANGVPKDNVEKALARASGSKDKGSSQLMYEAMAHGSVGILIECLTDNANRTLHALREILNDHNGRFAPVSFMFAKKGRVRVALDKGKDHEERVEQLIETALEAGAEDFETVDSSDSTVEVEFTCPPNVLSKVASAATAPGKYRELLESELVYVPTEPGEEADESLTNSISELVEALEDNEDTIRVWTTLD
ncbi:YebC-like protein [Gloeophyllum trabeum ATCC 11539]|uniref:YebC-like protein n=1 Tax=Gloeophyllum trabeum (strain ATCC 11539 / FP-39264 / Madison 617) TaxID=670483 RepID=S7RYH4_GLOTA|nr:YebC-like protein [Gloeophyllum trabeum ATCC 11539]EPQ58454.1 YebC-like protein [Gloeophyllum trabeum ATCC 11539]